MTVGTAGTTRASARATMARPAGAPCGVWPIMSGVLPVLLLASLDQTIVGTVMPLTARQRRYQS